MSMDTADDASVIDARNSVRTGKERFDTYQYLSTMGHTKGTPKHKKRMHGKHNVPPFQKALL